MSNNGPSIRDWILVPSIITLLVTLLRVTGELQGWSQLFFGTAGGGFALVGIIWLVPIFGIYFGSKMASSGDRPESAGKVALRAFVGLLVAILSGIVTFFVLGGVSWVSGLLGIVITWIVYKLVSRSWPSLFRVLLYYGFAARIPVAIVALLAIYGNWGTHYELGPEGYVHDNALLKWVEIGLLPQLTGWVQFTLIFGGFFALIGTLFAKSEPESAA